MTTNNKKYRDKIYRDKNKEAISERRKKKREENKEAFNEHARKYRQENKEAINKRKRKYRDKNKEAINKRKRKKREENKEAFNEHARKYGQENKEAINKRKRKYRDKNKETISEYDKIYREKNREVLRERNKIYRDKNKEAISERIRKKGEENPFIRLNNNMSSAIRRGLKKGKEGKSWIKLVDYTLEELIKHLGQGFTEGMTWDNHGWGKDKWHIDHRRPQSWFKFETIDDPEFKECWALGNLQPKWQTDNISKGNRYED